MRALEILLERRWILKSREKELYYQIKDELGTVKKFLMEKLGYQVIVNPYLVKVEKMPATPENWMGIQEFTRKIEYVFFCMILMFLEEKEAEEQFVLSELTEYIQGQYREEQIDWTVWDVIQRVLLDTSKTVPMEEYAKAAGMTKVTLNRKIVRRCGYTFFQLQKMGKIFNACALLHFPDLNIQYISDYLGFTNIEDFYRVFKRYMNVSVREYQKQNVGNGMQMHSEEEALQILVYLILNFHDPFQMKEMEKVLKKNAHLLERRAREVFGRSVLELLEEVRIQISCSYLVATDRTVTQISSDVGFGSISSFQRSFFKYMNQTPSQFRCSMKSK